MEVDDPVGAHATLAGGEAVSQAGSSLGNGDGVAAAPGSFSVRCAHGSERAVIDNLHPTLTSVGDLRRRLAKRFGVPVAQQTNIILRGRNLTKVADETTIADAGLDADFKGRLVLAGTTAAETERFKAEEEAVVRRDAAMQRARERAPGSDTDGGGGGGGGSARVVNVAAINAGRFLRLEPLPREALPAGAAGPAEALALLERLRDDRGIAALMQKCVVCKRTCTFANND
jgi:hypothetical protein